MRRFKQTIYTRGRLLPSCLLRETTKKGFNNEDYAVWFCVTISITISDSFFFMLMLSLSSMFLIILQYI